MQLKTWQEEYPALQGLSVNVNISSKQFSHPRIEQQVVEALNASDLNASCLKLEITEKVLINNYSAARKVFSILQELGVEIQLDDFGTGYSSLGYLQHFQINALKVDRSFMKWIKIIRALNSSGQSSPWHMHWGFPLLPKALKPIMSCMS
jgi:EAL domain-containing protein (putative c-di-GMP-specific phosphodiesterase class I)